MESSCASDGLPLATELAALTAELEAARLEIYQLKNGSRKGG
jgi:hypothetical protein